jgi:hypothetical protein
MISLPHLTFIIIAIRSFLSIVILYELSKCLKILIKKKIPGPLGPKVSAGRRALLYSHKIYENSVKSHKNSEKAK